MASSNLWSGQAYEFCSPNNGCLPPSSLLTRCFNVNNGPDDEIGEMAETGRPLSPRVRLLLKGIDSAG